MKSLVNLRLISIILLLTGFTIDSLGVNKKTEKDESETKKVLIVGMQDNVKSNHFYDTWIAEETGIAENKIDETYNGIIGQNIAASVKDGACKFVYPNTNEREGSLLSKVKIEGEGEDCHADLSNLSDKELKQLLADYNCDYVLLLNQHYLKWQEKPMVTIFHIVNYSLIDANKNEILSGNNNFTSMNLEKPEKMKQLSRKSSSKIAANIEKILVNR